MANLLYAYEAHRTLRIARCILEYDCKYPSASYKLTDRELGILADAIAFATSN